MNFLWQNIFKFALDVIKEGLLFAAKTYMYKKNEFIFAFFVELLYCTCIVDGNKYKCFINTTILTSSNEYKVITILISSNLS